jgi:NNP family nitrate/nitrite transporter-like MFS transporter
MRKRHPEIMTTHCSVASASSFRLQIPVLLLLAGIFFSSFLPRVILAPFLIAIEAELQIGHAEAGRLFLLISAGVSIGLLVSGVVNSKLLHKWVILLACGLIGTASLVLSWSESAGLLKSSLFCIGLGAGLYFPSGIACITSLVRADDWGKGLAIHELAPNLAFVAAPVIADLLGAAASWRSLFAFMGLQTYGVALLYAWKGRGGEFRGESPGFHALREISVLPAFWMMVVLFGLAVGGSIGVYTMTPLYLVTTKGFDLEAANGLTAAARIPGVFMAIISGWLADSLGSRRAIFLFSLLTGIFTGLLAWTGQSGIALLVVMQSVLSVCFFPAGFAVLSHIVEPRRRSIAVSLCVPAAVLVGAGVVPSFMGFLAEQGRFPLGFLLLGLAMVAASFCSLLLRYSPAGDGAEPVGTTSPEKG